MQAIDLTSLLADTAKRQADLVLSQDSPSYLFFHLTRFLALIDREPMLATLAAEAELDAERIVAEFAERDRALCAKLRDIVAEYDDVLRRRWPNHGPEIFEGSRSFDVFRSRFDREHRIAFDRHQMPETMDPGITRTLLQNIEVALHETRRSKRKQQREDFESRDNEFVDALTPLRRLQKHSFRSLRLELETNAGFAILRLRANAKVVNPAPAVAESPGDAEFISEIEGRFAKELFEPSHPPKPQQSTSNLAAQVRRDVRVFLEDLLLRIAVGRSRLAVMKRFAARCERYDAERLREHCKTDEGTGTRRAIEARLTLEFARYLFDQGLNPLVDAPIASLRPDVFDPHLGSATYVEAKQYSSGERATLKKDVMQWLRQVLDTWARLRQTHELPEAFLVVFRVRGALLELPEWIPVHGRRLYFVLVDIAESRESGSKQKDDPVIVDAVELCDALQVPTVSDEQGVEQAQTQGAAS